MPRGARFLAKSAGETTYTTGKPCKMGHDAPRITSNGNCVECMKVTKKRHYDNGGASYYKQYAEENYSSKFSCYETWTPEVQQRIERFNTARSESKRKWDRSNPSKVKTKKSRIGRATPEWVDYAEIDEIYFQAHLLSQSTGMPHVVDHIEPLYGKTCCGLNVPWNLQALPAHLNREKSNSRTWTHPDYEVPNTLKMKIPGTSPGISTEILLLGSQSPE